MTALIDVDQLRTFIAIAETGSFTKAADVVNKTQSAVSMQMKRLEERLERPIFARDGRASKLTEDGQRLLDYARRIVKLNVETLAAFSDAELSGRVRPWRARRLCRPLSAGDHGALLARLSRRRVDRDLRAKCRPARAHRCQRDRHRHRHQLREQAHLGNVPPRAAVVGDLATGIRPISRSACRWRSAARPARGGASRSNGSKKSARPYRILYSSSNAGAVAAAVLAGLAVSVLPELGLRPGMRVLTAAEGFPELPSCRIGLVRSAHESSTRPTRWAEHIISSLDNLSEAAQAAE